MENTINTNKNMNTIQKSVRSLAWSLIIVYAIGFFSPIVSYAGGPTQPESSTFTPIGMSDMVDPFTGDFSYNIPLMDIEGYPINIAYNGGITMDQEASWVGLGWNLNAGSIVRNLRGLPDDFNGDKIKKTYHQKPNNTIDVGFGVGIEAFGQKTKIKKLNDLLGLNASVSLGYNNYSGFTSGFSIGPSFSFATQLGAADLGFSLSGSSENGSSFAPNLSLSNKLKKSDDASHSLGGTIGASFNTRAGLTQLSVGIKRAGFEKGLDRVKARDGKHEGSVSSSFDLGLHTYSPSAGVGLNSFSIAGKVKWGPDFVGVDGTAHASLSYSRQWVAKEYAIRENPAYGFFNLETGNKDETALLDFNRDNDGSFTKHSPYLPSAYLTADIYSVMAQGTSGSFKGFRHEVGHVSDPAIKNITVAGSAGFELGLGNLAKVGADISVNTTVASSGKWTDFNAAYGKLYFNDATGASEKFAMQEANEKAIDSYDASKFGYKSAVLLPVNGKKDYTGLGASFEYWNQGTANLTISDNLPRPARLVRNNVLSFLSHADLKNGMGISPISPSGYALAPDHHVGEITQLNADGRRYVFGLAAYNTLQNEATFAVGEPLGSGAGNVLASNFEGLIGYTPTDASIDNAKGIDHMYSATETPAYAHSHMLTAVLSADYVDADGLQGPSIDDFGSYVKFDYTKKTGHKWRNPMNESKAYYDEGLRTDTKDDKASYTYGEKDLLYTNTITTKNYIAVFELAPRTDGYGVANQTGAINTNELSAMQLLKGIKLYARADYLTNGVNAVVLQEVIFTYDYTLCPNFPGNFSAGGKLTLKSISFKYQGSNKMLKSGYKFYYGGATSTLPGFNPGYDMKATDRWGTYKANGAGNESLSSLPMRNSDFPYAEQNSVTANTNVAAWTLTRIELPSGGAIDIEYESDDYAFVQHLPALQMFKIVGIDVDYVDDIFSGLSTTEAQSHIISDDNDKNRYIFFEKKAGFPYASSYASVGNEIYFRALMDFKSKQSPNENKAYEYVSGYAKIAEIGDVPPASPTSPKYGYIKFEGEKFKDNGNADYHPFTKAAIQMGRLHMTRYLYDLNYGDADDADEELNVESFVSSLQQSIGSLKEMFKGPNEHLYDKYNVGKKMMVNKSFIRLKEPSQKKLGGGHRVKSIKMYDNWNIMTDDQDSDFHYGQEYSYVNKDGTSSGVASYEPMLGGDENPWKHAIPYSEKKRWAVDDKLYEETPICESQMPSPQVGYSRVVVRDLTRTGVSRTATGYVVKEFYTAKDFPAIATATETNLITARSWLPLLPSYNYMTVSQGFAIELNDMHGKPKTESVYSQNGVAPISEVLYFYKKTPEVVDGIAANRLSNDVKVVHADGTSATREVGVKYEMLADFVENKTQSIGGAIQINANAFILGVIPIAVPIVWPSFEQSTNLFKRAGFTKTINRYGIVDSVVAIQNGSRVTTKNLAYDANTGEVLATETATNFNDEVYSMNYPAYWHYDQMGQAYKNIGSRVSLIVGSSGFASYSNSNALFVEGDELIADEFGSAGPVKVWVVSASATAIKLVKKDGVPLAGGSYDISVYRSGRKNLQTTSMGSVTTMTNPLNSLLSNNYGKVLNAGAVQFSNDWKTYCDCFGIAPATSTTNPYVLGTKGNWRPIRSYTHLTGRTQSNLNLNTNIRQDGLFTSYTPYYKNVAGKWNINPANWTYVSEVTSFSPNGMTLETKDALGRYSASLFGFKNTLTSAVGANMQQQQMTFDGFEDYGNRNCADAHHKFFTTPPVLSTNESHTGKYSLEVAGGASAVITVTAGQACETTKDCRISIDKIDIASQTIANGNTPYTMEYELIFGEYSPALNGSVITIVQDGAAPGLYEMIITITDSKGCVVTKTIKN
jgi:hypothetical protein